MANTQITPFQLTDQFTMDNFNQRINEINTALQNKPSKSPVHVDDANDVTKSGFYTCKTNIPFGYGLANVLAVGDIDDPNNVFTQIAFGVNLTPTNRNAIAVRCYVPGEGFHDWEWVNPPMTLGVEYRTTERYQGKPVYVKLVDFGALPNASKADVYHNISNINYIVSATGTAKNTTDGWTFNFPSSPRLPYVSALMVSTESIIASTSVDWSLFNLYVTMKYTKTTD